MLLNLFIVGQCERTVRGVHFFEYMYTLNSPSPQSAVFPLCPCINNFGLAWRQCGDPTIDACMYHIMYICFKKKIGQLTLIQVLRFLHYFLPSSRLQEE